MRRESMEAGAGRRGIPSLLKSPAARADESGGATSPQQEHIASDITQLVGWTPLVELKRIAQKDNVDARVVGKLECYQPLCSVKDRSALRYYLLSMVRAPTTLVIFFSTNVQSCGCHVLHRMIEDAEERGLISPGATTLVEPTSGNMGIALAYIALARGYRFVAVMPAEYSLDKQILLRYLGADLVLTDPALGFQGQLDKLEQLRKEIPNAHVLDQFANAANPEAHFRWTGSTDLCTGASDLIRE
eukprot:XP_020399570.1 putative inactive cysteine synthase 2 isoform X1 [Zea mays]